MPAWPMRRVPRIFRARSTSACDVIPDGLSISRSPSVFPSLTRFLVFSYLSKQRLDTRRALDALIELEVNLRRIAQPERSTQSRPQMRRDAAERFERRRPFFGRAEDADEHFRLAKTAVPK